MWLQCRLDLNLWHCTFLAGPFVRGFIYKNNFEPEPLQIENVENPIAGDLFPFYSCFKWYVIQIRGLRVIFGEILSTTRSVQIAPKMKSYYKYHNIFGEVISFVLFVQNRRNLFWKWTLSQSFGTGSRSFGTGSWLQISQYWLPHRKKEKEFSRSRIQNWWQS